MLLMRSPFWRGPPQDVDLLAQHQVLRLERPSRSEQPDKRPPSQSAKVPHRTTASPDSQPLASRTRFPIGTGVAALFLAGFTRSHPNRRRSDGTPGANVSRATLALPPPCNHFRFA